MNTCNSLIMGVFICLAIGSAQAAPNGVILYRNGVRIGHANVPPSEASNLAYFGDFLRGPIIENKFCSWRCFMVAANRVAFDINGKKIEGSTLNNYTSTFDTHQTLDWCTDIFEVGSNNVGIGGFRVYDGTNLLCPDYGTNLDSLTIAINDSSTASPKMTIGYWGWRIATNKKMNLAWTISTRYDQRTVDCEIKMTGDSVGKIITGIRKTTATMFQDQSKGLLYTLGKTNSTVASVANDSLLLAVRTDPVYFDSYTQNADQYSLVMKYDATRTVKWSFVSSWAQELNPLFRNTHWITATYGATSAHQPAAQIVHAKKAEAQTLISGFNSHNINESKSTQYFNIRGCRVQNISNEGILIIRK